MALFILIPLLATAADEDEFTDVSIEVVPVAEGLAMLTGAGGNLGVCWGEDGVFLIDDQYAPLTGRITAAVATLDDGPIRFVLNTHWHGDHTGGNENLGAAGSVLVSHDNVRRRLSTEQYMEFFAETRPAAPADALPVVTFNDSLTFHLNGQRIVVHHSPRAHTDGDGVVHFVDANVIHAGDIVFYGLYPFIDLSAGGGIDGMVAGAEAILDMCDADTRIIPGHGPLLGRAELRAYVAMLQGVRDAVAEAMADGSDLAAVQAKQPAAPWDEDWGQTWLTSEQFVELVYGSLAGER